MEKFKEGSTLEQRVKQSRNLLQKYNDRIPVIIHPGNKITPSADKYFQYRKNYSYRSADSQGDCIRVQHHQPAHKCKQGGDQGVSDGGDGCF